MINKKAISLELARSLKESSLSDLIYLQNNKYTILFLNLPEELDNSTAHSILTTLRCNYSNRCRDTRVITLILSVFRAGYISNIHTMFPIDNAICVFVEEVSTSNHIIDYDFLFKDIKHICDIYGVAYLNDDLFTITLDLNHEFIEYKEII